MTHKPQATQRAPLGSPTSALLPASLMYGDGAEFSDANDAMLDAKHSVASPRGPSGRPLKPPAGRPRHTTPHITPGQGGHSPPPPYYSYAPPQPAPAPPPPPMPPGPAALRRRAAPRKSAHVKRDNRPHATARTASGALPPSAALLHSSSAPALDRQGPGDLAPWEVALPDADRVGDQTDELLQESESDVSGMVGGARSSSRARRTKQQWASGRSSILKMEQELAELDTTVRTTLHQPVSELAGLGNHSVANHVR